MKALPGPGSSSRRAYWYLAAGVLTAFAIWRAPSGEADDEVQPVMRPHRASPAPPLSHASPWILPQRVLAGAARVDLFASHSWYVPPPPPPPQQAEPMEPVAPPLPYELIGSYAHDGEPTVFFLSRDDRVFDVHIGDILENTYSVDAQANGQLQLTYLPLKTRQTLNLGGSQ
jgi:hypothetical protein